MECSCQACRLPTDSGDPIVITYVEGNLFESPAQVLVNTVNTKGVMGKGIALEFKRIYPEMFREYRDLCEQEKIAIGTLHLYKTPHKSILNFPTKKDWRQPSRIEYVEAGLRTFVKMYGEKGITSVAFPPLGCGNGQLDFESQVMPLMEQYLGRLSIPTFIYPQKRRIGPVEHKDAKAIAEWLRSEPASLPFDEVWQDILQVLEDRTVFHTSAKRKAIKVFANEDPPSIAVESSGKVYKIGSDDLLEFWQQLRDYGFTYRSIAPEHYRLSYLISVFEQLPYVHRVAVSESTEGLRKNAAVGLQVIPPPRQDKRLLGDLFALRVNGTKAGR